jgi:hypothetical protein
LPVSKDLSRDQAVVVDASGADLRRFSSYPEHAQKSFGFLYANGVFKNIVDSGANYTMAGGPGA